MIFFEENIIMKYCIPVLFICASINSYAQQICPSVAEIKQSQLKGWTAYGYQGEPLTPEEFKDFQNNVRQFHIAQWLNGAPDGEAQCFYINRDAAYLTKPNLKPIFNSQNKWRWISQNEVASCEGGMIEGCRFSG